MKVNDKSLNLLPSKQEMRVEIQISDFEERKITNVTQITKDKTTSWK